MIAQCIRFWPEYLFLRQAVERAPMASCSRCTCRASAGARSGRGRTGSSTRRAAAAAIYDLHIHDVDYVHSLLGMPDRVQATGRATEATGGYDVDARALSTMTTGRRCTFTPGGAWPRFPFQAAVRGLVRARRSCAMTGAAIPPLTVFDDLTQATAQPAEYEPGDAYYNEIAYFLRLRRDGRRRPIECPPARRATRWRWWSARSRRSRRRTTDDGRDRSEFDLP